MKIIYFLKNVRYVVLGIFIHAFVVDDPSYPVTDAVKDLIMYTSFEIFGVTIMLSDLPPEMKYTQGINVGLAVVLDNVEELARIFNALSEGGTVDMPLGKTFWSELYGMVTDKFGVQWQVNFEKESDDCK